MSDYRYSLGEIIKRVAFSLVAVLAIVLFVLAFLKTINLNPYKLGFSVLTLGWGIISVIAETIDNGYFSLPWGGVFLLTVGTVVLLIGVLAWYFIALIGVAMLALGVFASAWLGAAFEPDYHEPTTIFDKKTDDR